MVVGCLYSQTNNFWVFFNDKDCSTYFGLSERSIERRLTQNIELDFYDLLVCQKYIDSLKSHDISIRHQSRWLNAVSVSVNSNEAIAKILNYDFVKTITPVNSIIRNDNPELFVDNVIQYYPRIAYSLPYGSSLNQIDMLGGVDLHNAGFLGENVLIAVFDA